jgi:hypothetical protein
MIKMGFTNVKYVHGGGKAMEKYFEYYTAGAYGGKTVNPITGKEVIIKKPY